MNIILLSHRRGMPVSLNLTGASLYAPVIAAFVSISLMVAMAGYWLGTRAGGGEPVALVEELRGQLAAQQQELVDARRRAQADLDALALRLGQLQAQALRLDGLGQTLTGLAGLDEGEFNFSDQPGVGGPAELSELAAPIPVPEFMQQLDALGAQLDDREHQLAVLESMLLNQTFDAARLPQGRPVRSGWISSYYGARNDPFTGRKSSHHGMDFAGKRGSDVVAVASGVVTASKSSSGYGKLIEIDHGNGYKTRYGHNQKNLVGVGDTVKKGQTIALMGSSGRSTGPHVHFEVLKNGKPINPNRYIQAKR